MNKIIIIIIVLAVIAGGAYFVLNSNSSVTAPVNTSGQYAYEYPYPTPSVTSNTTTTQTPQSNSTTTTTTTIQTQVNIPVPITTPVTHNLAIRNFSFSPSAITIKKGDSVVWTNMDSAPHTVTGTNGGPASGTLNLNGTYKFTFNNTGTFNYRCTIHPNMTGVVTVIE